MTADELADRALAIAWSEFDERVQTIVDHANGDSQLIASAARIVSKKSTKADGAEHIAFAYVTAAFRRMAPART